MPRRGRGAPEFPGAVGGAAIRERQIAALVELGMAALLAVLMLGALVQFLRMARRPELEAGRFLYLPIGLVLGVLYAAWRGARAVRRLRERGPR